MFFAWHAVAWIHKTSREPLLKAFCREDLQLMRAMLYAWHRAVLVVEYAADLRLTLGRSCRLTLAEASAALGGGQGPCLQGRRTAAGAALESGT